MDENHIIEVKNLKLSFDDGTAFDFSNINIKRGIITGIIGSNGSGKTTFVEAVLGLRSPKTSNITIDGISQKQYFTDIKNRKNLGSQLQVFAFSEMVKVNEMVKLHKALYGKQSQRVYDDLSIAEIANKRLDRLSGGQKQRVNLYMALAHMPKLITLDEPSSALDKAMAEKLINLLKHMVANENCTILMITHHPYELDICDEVLTIHAGSKGYQDSHKNFLTNIIGEFHAQIFIGDNDDKTTIKTAIETIAHAKRHFENSDQIDIYGTAAMESGFLAMIKQHNIKSYSFARSNSADILKISTIFTG
ncbi:MAG: ABC transporter ATP-binding protein [Hyphomicrobiales bacterium]